jgi:hypothetical protein
VLDGFLSSLVLLGPHDVDCGGVERSLDVRRIVFFDHLDASSAVLCDLVDVGTFHKAQADVCVPQAVLRTRSAFAVEAKIFLVEDGLEKFALPLRENKVRRCGHAPFFAESCGGHGRFYGRVHAINARLAKPASKSLKGLTAPGIPLQYLSLPSVANIKTWQFEPGQRITFVVTYMYNIAGEQTPLPENPKVEVELPRVVKVTVRPFKPSCSDCASQNRDGQKSHRDAASLGHEAGHAQGSEPEK